MCAAFCPNSLKFLRTAATFICKDNFFVLLSKEDSHISTVEIYRYINEAIVMRDTMEARSTILHLFVYLLIGWVVWIIVNFIEKTVSCVCSWCHFCYQAYIKFTLYKSNLHFFQFKGTSSWFHKIYQLTNIACDGNDRGRLSFETDLFHNPARENWGKKYCTR